MGTFILRRILYSIPVLIATSFIIFTFVSLAGDPLGQLKLNPYLSEETLQNKIEEKHLDKPIPVRYLYWVKEASTDKFGTSLSSDQPIWPDLKRVIPHTLELLIPALLLSVLFAVGIGLYSAIRQYSVFDYGATTFSFLAYAVPVFWLALMLQILATQLVVKWNVRLFYTSGLSSTDPGGGLQFVLDRAQHLALPMITIAVIRSPRTVATCAPRCWRWSTPTTPVRPARRDCRRGRSRRSTPCATLSFHSSLSWRSTSGH